MRRLLVIDDSLTIRKLVELSFRDHGWTIDLATSGAEGVAKAASLVPDLILLDFVLPDMKATEVCERLAANPKSAQPPVILMSAKMESVRDLFKPFPMVVDFVAKPFTTPEILRIATRALSSRAQPPEVNAPGFSFKHKEAAANALFGNLRAELAHIPEWAQQLGQAAAAPFFARRILTPDAVGRVLEALLPLYRELLSKTEALATAAPELGDAALQGQTASWPLHDLLCALGSSSRTGELCIAYDAQRIISYWQSGEIILVTSHDPTDYACDVDLSLAGVATAERERAGLEQRAGGKPFYVTLAERGAALPCDLTALVEQQGRRLLGEALAARSARFVWRERAALPDYVATWGRHLELAPQPQAAGIDRMHTLAQLTLERLRRPSSWSEAEAHLPGPAATYDRAPGFSSKLVQLTLGANEQRVLTLIDGKTPLSLIAERAGIVSKEVVRILYRLAQVELIVAPARPSSQRSRNSPATRPVMILEPDHEGFHDPLRTLLHSRPEPLELVDLAGEPDLLAAIKRERPALVILNESTSDADIGDVARAIRATPQLANVSLAAVLESRAQAKMDDLAAAGFDAVLVKPVHYLDLSQLIASSCLAAHTPTRPRAPGNSGKETFAADRR